MKKIAIIIPHFNGIEILDECLKSLIDSLHDNASVYVVDNGSSDGSVEFVKNNYPWVNIFSLQSNLGYSGGCNYGFENTSEELVIFLNNDTVHENDWLDKILIKMESDERIGALQPKIKSYYSRDKFDYSGACGGEIDYLGYPFARGRIFEDIEIDNKQYDKIDDNIFWASGTAMVVRRKALNEVGLLDHDFFAHMEEIDLSWRLHLFGWKVKIEPKSVVYHHSGYTLGKMNSFKMYLNHRNNLFMLYKNLPQNMLINILSKRIILEVLTIIVSLVKLDCKRFGAVIKALFSFYKDLHLFKEKRKVIQKHAVKSQLNIYPKSIVYKYFIKKIKTYTLLILK